MSNIAQNMQGLQGLSNGGWVTRPEFDYIKARGAEVDALVAFCKRLALPPSEVEQLKARVAKLEAELKAARQPYYYYYTQPSNWQQLLYPSPWKSY